MGQFSKKEPQQFDVAGKKLQCPVCANTTFRTRKAQLNSALASFFDLDFLNRSATCYVCSECSHISWFLH